MKLDSKGQLLIEMLAAIAVIALIIVAVSNLFIVNMKESKFTEGRNDALMLAQEGMEAIRSISENSWHNIYLPPMGDGNKDDKGADNIYCLTNNGTAWNMTGPFLASGPYADCEISMNNRTYSRKIIIDDVKRENGNISESLGSDDPSTQKITVIISYEDGKDVVLEQYQTRWKNRILKQNDWSSPAPADQAGCEALLGTWDSSLSVCTVGLDTAANETGWSSYDDLDGGSGKLDTAGGSLKFK